MYDLQLTPEQIEFRDALRDFVNQELKPAAIDPKRLEPFEKPLMTDFLDQLSQMGLRSLALPEEAGGAGADLLTSCVLLEEIAVGDVDLAVVLGETSLLARAAHAAMNDDQRKRWMGKFEGGERFHLALIARDADIGRGWSYHQALSEEDAPAGTPEVSAKRDGKGWVINGLAPFVSNAPVAGMFIVQAKIEDGSGSVTVLIGSDAKGVSIDEELPAFGDGGAHARWGHGAIAAVKLDGCKVGPEDVIADDAARRLLHGDLHARRMTQMTAINIGVSRAAYEAAVDYAKMRWQGGRHIVEHQAIGMKLADVAIQLEAARGLALKAAYVADHLEAVHERSINDLPWHVVARSFAAENLHRATLEATECFGAMGVMRDMPLQKYVHDTLVLKHSLDADLASPLVVAEAVAGYQR